MFILYCSTNFKLERNAMSKNITSQILAGYRPTARQFMKDTSGSFLIIFTLVLLVVLFSMGALMDYLRMKDAKSDFQNALDSATLAAAISLKEHGWDQAKIDGKDHFLANIDDGSNSNITSVDFTYENDVVYGKLVGHSDTYFMSVAGIDDMNYTVNAAVKFPNYPLEVSMVLDTTGSMSVGGKMTTLKTAANDFVDAILSVSTADRKISIVPFAQYVNVGRDKLGESWLDAADQVVHVPEQCSTNTPIISQSGCTTTTTNHPAQNIPEQCTGAVYNDGVMVSPASCTPAYTQPAYTSTSETCANTVYGTPVTTCQPAYDYTIEWNGCVASRNYPRNLEDGEYNKKVPGPNGLTCPAAITALTDNKTVLKNAISALTPVGNTYIPQGIVWGTRTLSPGKPFEGGRSTSEMAALKGKKFMVLMTDGENVVSPEIPDLPLHTGTNINKANDWLIESCNNAKNTDITIYTVSFGSGVSNDTKNLMKSCASKNKFYFHASSNAALKKSFKEIADSILTIHLSL